MIFRSARAYPSGLWREGKREGRLITRRRDENYSFDKSDISKGLEHIRYQNPCKSARDFFAESFFFTPTLVTTVDPFNLFWRKEKIILCTISYPLIFRYELREIAHADP